ncbi:hypothetical protein [Amycolatopsis sp. BJA-103]|uniref:hypothetical protein n=1 Tax=Amycolatopsis sp. BJA-103 TaxID=1911175 RepID=UPI000C788E4D|nr:hypothetical protein [Amycolatopsis sp. BJA-103]AUI61471.1 hypothetical protein BKN51_27060 [Amycolatopsis sp. BJA-103]PNE21235.1 hypothetical protein B1H26_05395 [Amycolatopsis sp. BJA-103]
MRAALLRKGSRRIVVDETAYRWNIRRKPTFSQEDGCFLSYAVELEDARGAVLLVRTDHGHPSNYLGVPSKAVLPSDVERAIRLGLECGWEPGAPGAQFQLDLAAAQGS